MPCSVKFDRTTINVFQNIISQQENVSQLAQIDSSTSTHESIENNIKTLNSILVSAAEKAGAIRKKRFPNSRKRKQKIQIIY